MPCAEIAFGLIISIGGPAGSLQDLAKAAQGVGRDDSQDAEVGVHLEAGIGDGLEGGVWLDDGAGDRQRRDQGSAVDRRGLGVLRFEGDDEDGVLKVGDGCQGEGELGTMAIAARSVLARALE